MTFAPVSIAATTTRATVRLGTEAPTGVAVQTGVAPAASSIDALARDNVFNFVITPSAPVPVTVVTQGNRGDANLYLSRALAIGEAPRFETSLQSAEALAGDAVNRARLLILNDVSVPRGGGGQARHLRRGRRRPADGARPARVVAVGARGVAAGRDRRRRSIARAARRPS